MHSDTIRLRELTLRYDVKRDSNGHEIQVGPRLRTPSDSARLLMTVLHGQASEVFGILCLSTRHDVIGYHEVARGTLDSVIVEPREVFRPAILANAPSLVLSHNHPSGDPTPSTNDFDLTTRLISAGTLLGIEVLDHIIVGDLRYVSFKEIGHI